MLRGFSVPTGFAWSSRSREVSGPARRIIRRWSGPRWRYTSLVAEHRAPPRPLNGLNVVSRRHTNGELRCPVQKEAIRLEEREEEFLALLRSGASETRVTEAVDELRAAHVRALKEKRQNVAPSEKNSAVYAEIEEAIRRWMELPNDAIIEGYRDPKQRRKMSSAVRRAANYPR